MSRYKPIKFLSGSKEDIDKQPFIPGQVYFTTFHEIDPETLSTIFKGEITFDDPETNERIKLHTDATNSTFAKEAEIAINAQNDSLGSPISQKYIQDLSFDPNTYSLIFIDGEGAEREVKLSLAHDHYYAGSTGLGGSANTVAWKKEDEINAPLSIPFGDSSSKTTETQAQLGYDDKLKYYPASGTLMANKFEGEASYASTAKYVPWDGILNAPNMISDINLNMINELVISYLNGNIRTVGAFAPLDGGKIPLTYLPAGAFSSIKIVESYEEMLQLTPEDVQEGDSVQVGVDGPIYLVVNVNYLHDLDKGYVQYSSGGVNNVLWSEIKSRPDLVHNISPITVDDPLVRVDANALLVTYLGDQGNQTQQAIMSFVPLTGTSDITGPITGDLKLDNYKKLYTDYIIPNNGYLDLRGKITFDSQGVYYIEEGGAEYSGNAASATKAKYDSSGEQEIISTYIKQIYLDNKTLKALNGLGGNLDFCNIDLSDTFLPLDGGSMNGRLELYGGLIVHSEGIEVFDNSIFHNDLTIEEQLIVGTSETDAGQLTIFGSQNISQELSVGNFIGTNNLQVYQTGNIFDLIIGNSLTLYAHTISDGALELKGFFNNSEEPNTYGYGLYVHENAYIGGTLNVIKDSVLGANLTVKENIIGELDLSITGNTTLTGETIIKNNFTVEGEESATYLQGNLTVDKTVSLNSGLITLGSAEFDDNVQINKNLVVNEILRVNGNVILGDSVAEDTIKINGTTDIIGNTSITGTNINGTALDLQGGKFKFANGGEITSIANFNLAASGVPANITLPSNSVLKWTDKSGPTIGLNTDNRGGIVINPIPTNYGINPDQGLLIGKDILKWNNDTIATHTYTADYVASELVNYLDLNGQGEMRGLLKATQGVKIGNARLTYSNNSLIINFI